MSTKVDTSEVDAFLRKAVFTATEMLIMEKPAALTIVNAQRARVPVDTAATKTSISSEIQVSTGRLVTDHIGPSTTYAPSIEFGVVSKPNYPIQPFVRTSVMGPGGKLVEKVAGIALKKMVQRKHGGA